MKIKSGIIYNALQTINNLSEKPMKVSLTAKLLRLSYDLQKENEIIEKQRRDILTKYCDKDENGQPIIDENGNVTFNNGNVDEVQKELNELSNIEVDIIDRNITEQELENNNLELTINEFALIENFLHKENE